MSPAAASLVPERPVLVAPERFGHALRATQVAGALGRGLERAGLRPPDLCPLADGGPGTAEVLLTALGGETGDGFALLEDGGTGLVEAGHDSTVTGERIARALDAGAAVVLVAAGADVADADVEGADAGAGASDDASADASHDTSAGALEVLAARGGVGGARLVVLCDAPDSGSLAEALRSAHGAVLERGGPWVLAALGFDARMREARAVLTGAGRLGEASLPGLVGEVGRRARQSGVPLHAVTAHDALDPFAKRMIDLQVVLEAEDLAALEAAGESLGRELAAGLA